MTVCLAALQPRCVCFLVKMAVLMLRYAVKKLLMKEMFFSGPVLHIYSSIQRGGCTFIKNNRFNHKKQNRKADKDRRLLRTHLI